jgi:hypothetical protein
VEEGREGVEEVGGQKYLRCLVKEGAINASTRHHGMARRPQTCSSLASTMASEASIGQNKGV